MYEALTTKTVPKRFGKSLEKNTYSNQKKTWNHSKAETVSSNPFVRGKKNCRASEIQRTASSSAKHRLKVISKPPKEGSMEPASQNSSKFARLNNHCESLANGTKHKSVRFTICLGRVTQSTKKRGERETMGDQILSVTKLRNTGCCGSNACRMV